MSKRRKTNFKQVREQRNARKLGDVPPPEAVASYADTFAMAAQVPEVFDEVRDMDPEVIDHLALGIAFPDRFQLPVGDDEVEGIAQVIKDWHILNGEVFFYEWWPKPIATMSPADIIVQIRQDAANGRFGEFDTVE